MAGFRVFMKPGGWRVSDGAQEYGPYPTYDQAMRSADNLNLQHRAHEERSFAPAAERNVQGGVPLSEAQHRLSPEIQSGDRRDAHLESNERGAEKAVHGEAPTSDLPPHMVAQTETTPEPGHGDVLTYPEGPSVWEALEHDDLHVQPDQEAAAREARERAQVPGTDSPAAASASLGGGLV